MPNHERTVNTIHRSKVTHLLEHFQNQVYYDKCIKRPYPVQISTLAQSR